MATKKHQKKSAARVRRVATAPKTKEIQVGPVKFKVPLSSALRKTIATLSAASKTQGGRQIQTSETLIKRGGRWLPLSELLSPDIQIEASPKVGEQELPRVVESRLFRSVVASALPAVTDVVFSELRASDPKIESRMDPRLQVCLARHRMGMPRAAFASVAASETAVLARVTDPDKWEAISEVRMGVIVGRATDSSGHLVTGRIPIDRIEHVRQDSCVISLKASRPLTPTLSDTTREIGLPPSGQASPEGGKGVVIGIVDFGCDFAHENFQRSNGGSRIEAIWDQSGITRPSSPKYGRVYTNADINQALKARDPYRQLGYGPQADFGAQKGTHGTHVMDIAAGNGLGSGVPGCAPQADIIFVDSSTSKLPWFGPEAVGRSLGDSVQLVEAVTWVFEQAGNRPCVVNLSMGTNGGPHDGRTLVEQSFDTLVRAAPNRAIVIAASNSFSDGIHASVTIPANGVSRLIWQAPPSTDGHELEVWFDSPALVAIELIAPDGTSLATVEPDKNVQLKMHNEVVVFISNRLNDPNGSGNLIGIFIAGGLPDGDWTIQLYSRVSESVSGHAWIERYDRAQSSFKTPDPRYTLGSISCGQETIVVGSYDAHKSALPISFFSSAGPTRDGREKPEVSAPGHNVVAARSRSIDGVTSKSGTSMAAPAITGVIALMLGEAVRKKTTLSITEIRRRLMQTARLQPPPGPNGIWEERFGMGRVSAAAIM